MNVIEFVLEVKKLHVFINREAGKLKVRGNREALVPELKQRLAEYKNQIIELYTSLDISSNSQLAPTTFSQQRLWFIDQLEGNSIHYNMPSAVRLRGDFSYEAIQRTLNSILERHESLRTTFARMGNEPYQVIHEHEDIDVPLRDLSQMEETVRDQELSRICREEANSAFALDRDRMMRWQLLKLSEDNHVLLRTYHHIASDGWSVGVLTREFSALYKAFLNGDENPLPPLAIQYADYAHWQRQWLKGEVLESQLKHWTDKLEGIPSVHSLPLDRPRPMVQSYRGHSIASRIDSELFEAFNKLCFQQGATLFMGLHAAFSLLLSRYSGETDIVVGTPIANREQPDVAPLCGFFLNTLVFRSRLDCVGSFIELMKQSKKAAWDAYAHQQVPFEQLATVLDLEHTLSYAPVFQIMLILQNNDNGAGESDGLVMEPVNTGFEVAKFDITLNITQLDNELILGWNYATDIFDMSTIGRMAANFEVLLRSVVAAPRGDLMTLPLIGGVEYKHCTAIWNNTAAKYDRECCIHELFEDRVVEAAMASAVVSGERQFSYGEVNEAANRLADYLVAEGVGPDVLIGVCLPRSVDMVVAVLAIMKAGGAYLPIDAEYPQQRIDYMCRDAELDLVVCHETLSFSTERETQFIYLDSLALQAQLEQRPSDNPEPRKRGLNAANRAYVIYTSGSAGLPKGVMVSHRNLHAYYTAAKANYRIGADDRVLQFSSFSFDIFVEEMFVALLSGATLVLRSEDVLLGDRYFWNFVREQALTMVSLPTAFWHRLCAQFDDKPVITGALRLLIVGGEAMSEVMLSRWQCAVGNHVRLLNTYGPTETTVVATTFDLADYTGKGSVPIGKAAANTQCYVLSAEQQVCPVSAHGELYIGGDAVALGYLNNPTLSEDKFIADPFSETSGARLYRSGDIVHYLPDGNLKIVGRVDDQVKIRGFRIELGEVESQLVKHEWLTAALVMAREDQPGDRRLVAYLVAHDASERDLAEAVTDKTLIAEVRRYAEARLPAYMLPTAYVVLDSLPLTAHGKVNRLALPAPDLSQLQAGYAAPEGATEEQLTELWEDTLKIARVGRFDNFFSLGGHSLMATQLASSMRETFSVEMDVRDLFEKQTIAAQAEIIDRKQQAGGISTERAAEMAIPRVPRDRTLQLSFAQQRLWFLSQYMGPSSVYNMPFVNRLNSDVNITAVIDSLSEIMNRHEALRTRFDVKDGQPVQIIDDPPAPPQIETVRSAEELKHICLSEEEYCFDLARDRLCRVRVLHDISKGNCEDYDGHYVLVVNIHHIVSDGWSMRIFFRELSTLYQAFASNADSPLAPLPIQYADYASWQRQWLRDDVLDTQLTYWRNQLGGLPPLLTLPTDRPRPAEQTYRGANQAIRLSPLLSMRLQALSQDQGTTLFMALISAFGVLMSRYSGQKNIAIGTPIASRTRRETEALIGFFANTLVMRCDLERNPTYLELLAKTRETALQAYAHQDVPFEMLVEALNPERSISHSPVFQVMFVLQNAPARSNVAARDRPDPDRDIPALEMSAVTFGQAASPGEAESGVSRFDMTLSLADTGRGIVGSLEYNTDLFDRATISRMLEHFERLLQSVVDAPQTPVSRLPLLGEADKQLQTVSWNRTDRAWPQEDCIHTLFEARAAEQGDAIALICGPAQLSYDDLNRRANRLAHKLIARGVGPEVCVGVCLERTPEMLVALLAVLKAGGAYVALDPGYPRQRLAWLIEDSSIELVLTSAHLKQSVLAEIIRNLKMPENRERDIHCIAVSGNSSERNAQTENPQTTVQAGNLAYIIYTSGSTGRPKGVAICHASAVALLSWAAAEIGAEDRRTILASTSMCFDLSVYEFFLPLTCGSQCLLVENILALGQLRQREQLSLINTVPSAAKALLDNDALPASLRVMNLAGEPLKRDLVDRLYQAQPVIRVFDLYGPSEDTTYSTFCQRNINGPETIGRPVANTDIYVLDQQGAVVPLGVVGELFIGGQGLARGYLGRSGLTAEKFVPHPFGTFAGARLYSTGDLVRYQPGVDDRPPALEFVGRVDYQVKVRGFRIEPGEIESVLLEYEAVSDAVVLAREDQPGSQQIVAYLVCTDKPAGSDEKADDNIVDALRSHLYKSLPDYMMPAHFVLLDQLPLTANGKIDRRALPGPDRARRRLEFRAPEGSVEEALAAIWCELLHLERVGRDDYFFELGGHSLLATQLVSRVRNQFSVELAIRVVFEHQQLSALASAIEKIDTKTESKDGVDALVPSDANEPIPLSYAQQRLWFLSQYMGPNSVYNMPLFWRLGASTNSGAIIGSLKEIYHRHDVLRTRFEFASPEPVQIIDDEPLALQLEDLEDATELRWVCKSEALHQFDLASESLCRMRVLRDLSDSESQEYGSLILLVTMHHSISDGWSVSVFQRELALLYHAFASGQESPLTALPIQYADYARWQRQWLQGEVLEKQLSYWRDRLEGLPPVLTLPIDHPRPAEQSFRGSYQAVRLSPELSSQLDSLSREQGATLFMTLLTAFSVLLGRYAGQDDVAIGTPIANRTRRETEDLIGYFANTLVMRSHLTGKSGFCDLLQQTKEHALEAYAHQDIPFEMLIEELQPERSTSHTPLFQVMFTLQTMSKTQAAARQEDATAENESTLNLRPLKLTKPDRESDDRKDVEGVSRFDLTLNLSESPEGIVGGMEYSSELFERTTIVRMLQHYQRLLRAIVAAPRRAIAELDFLSDTEKYQQLQAWNNTQRLRPDNDCVHQYFEEWAQQAGDTIALVNGSRQLSCAEVNRRANCLAHYLLAQGIGPEAIVGICLNRCFEQVIAVLGILKTGAAWLPLDPDYPEQRLAFMIEDSDVELIVSDVAIEDRILARLLKELDETQCCARKIVRASEVCRDNPDNPQRVLNPDNLAYLIYTSGSTGKPKGVEISHRSWINLLFSQRERFEFGAHSRVLQFASMNFDASVFELTALCHGASLCVLGDGENHSPEKLSALVVQQQLSHVLLPPAVLPHLDSAAMRSVRHLIVGGEAMPGEQVAAWSRDRTLYNAYGPTETTVCATLENCSDPSTVKTQSPPIGRPLPNMRCYVLDEAGALLPCGAVGELYIAGIQLARGYRSRPAITAERFVPDPFSGCSGERLYRSGDLVRYRADGRLEFVGRADQQIKLRGFRIEPGEIESLFRQHDAVADVVVLAREDEPGLKQLVAYVVMAPDGSEKLLQPATLTGELEQLAQAHLPEYMRPSAFVLLDALPLTVNGKLDKKALPASTGAEGQGSFHAPAGPTEELLSEIWCAILHRKEVSRSANFFALGGHSLLATLLASRIREVFAVELSIRELFEWQSLLQQAGAIDARRNQSMKVENLPLLPVSRDEPLRLSYAQQRLWFLNQYMGPNAVYNITMGRRLPGEVNIDALLWSLAEIIRRHEVLRTRYALHGGEPVQVIAAPYTLQLETVTSTEQLSTIYEAEQHYQFDLAEDRLCRIRVLQNANGEVDRDSACVLVITMHHSVSDGWSMGLFFRELVSLYQTFAAGLPSRLPDLPLQYADFAQWQRRWLQGDRLKAQLSFWREQLSGLPPLLTLPTDKARPPEQTFRGSYAGIQLPPLLSGRLQILSRKEGVTLYMTLLSAFAVLLSRYSGQTDLAIGTPVANRTRRETEAMIGFFVNTLVMRCDLSADPDFASLLQDTRERALQAYAHQDIPFEMLVEALKPERSLRHSPLFQVMFSFQNATQSQRSAGELATAPALQFAPMDFGTNQDEESLPADSLEPKGVSHFDLTLNLAESSAGLTGTMEYNTDLFERHTIERMLRHYERLLEAIVTRPDIQVSQVEFLSNADRHRQIHSWNATRRKWPRTLNVPALFEAQVNQRPDAVALIFAAQNEAPVQISYCELNRGANRLAHRLIEAGAGPEHRIGLCIERSPAMICGVLAILKAGAAYVPLDPTYPQARLAWLVKDSGLRLIVSRSDLAQGILAGAIADSGVAGRIRFIDVEAGSDDFPEENPGIACDPANLAYVIYTSGSTGRPKGVEIQHRGWTNLVCAQREVFQIEAHSRVLQFFSLNFDATASELAVTLCWGASLCLLSEMDCKSPQALTAIIEQNQLSHATLPPAVLGHLQPQALAAISHLVVAGEAISAEAATQWSTGRKLLNAYGPTETTVCATAGLYGGCRPDIGRPLANEQCFVLDRHAALVPAGVVGELHVGGIQLARAYLGRPGKTAERFIPNPFAREAGERLYATGDLVRYQPGADDTPPVLEFVGRVDEQVKVRGFRIEPGEIENVLRRYESLRDVAVLVREDEPGDRQIVAYVVAADPMKSAATGLHDHSVLLAELREYLRSQLPEYMLPAAYMPIEALPLTANGKLDRRALPKPDRAARHNKWLAPRGAVEELLATLWCAVLQLERVGHDENFFDLGGHSLLATRLLLRIRESFAVDLSVRDLFEYQTLSAQAGAIDRQRMLHSAPVSPPAIVAVARNRVLLLSHAQQRMWFLNLYVGPNPVYNVPLVLELPGSADAGALQRGLEEIVCRHEALRTRFESRSGVPVQIIDEPFAVEPEVVTSVIELKRTSRSEQNYPFDLRRDRPCRIRLLHFQPGTDNSAFLLLVTMHHSVSDGWSVGIFLRELDALYKAFSQGMASPLAALPIQYADYAHWQRQALGGDALESELGYWREQLAGLPALLDLPTDRPRPQFQTFRGAYQAGPLPLQLSQALQVLSRAQGVTLYMTLLSAFAILLGRYAAQKDIAIGTQIANRTQRESEDLIGCFVNTLVMRCDLSGDPEFTQVLQRTREVTLQAYSHQDLPFELLVDALNPKRSLSHSTLFQAMFTLHNQDMARLGAGSSNRTEVAPGRTDGAADGRPGTSRFDLSLSLNETPKGIVGGMEYNTDLFDQVTIVRMLEHFEVLLGAIVTAPERRISEFDFCSDAEDRRFDEWRAGRGDEVLEPDHRPVLYAEPEGNIEIRLQTIWCNILECDKVGRHDNFFELGGYSLLTTQLAARIHDEFSVVLPIRTFFEFQTIEGQASAIVR